VALSDLLKFGRKADRGGSVADAPSPKGPDPIIVSKALPKFVAALSQKPSPVLLDFGPVIGANVAFFGEHLGCKLIIEDLAAELDRHTKANTRDELPAALAKHFPHDDQSVDGILCWDIFDFLEKPSAAAVTREIVRVLKPGGAVMGFFCTSAVERAPFTKFEILHEQASLRHRHHPGTGGQKFVLQNRDIIKMFEGLYVSDSFLLKSNTREILLRRRS
jgi:predicted SAM-dependent methyltransferase